MLQQRGVKHVMERGRPMIETDRQAVERSRAEDVGLRAGSLAAASLAVGIVISAATGCGSIAQPEAAVAPSGAGVAAPAADASQPTFRDAIAALIDHDDRIRAAFEADDPDAAHDDLHAIGHLLEDQPKLAGTAGVAIDRQAVERSAGILLDAFARIDDTLHGGTGSTYAEESQAIARELSGFRAFLVEHRP
jgi:hypothetical protein